MINDDLLENSVDTIYSDTSEYSEGGGRRRVGNSNSNPKPRYNGNFSQQREQQSLANGEYVQDDRNSNNSNNKAAVKNVVLGKLKNRINLNNNNVGNNAGNNNNYNNNNNMGVVGVGGMGVGVGVGVGVGGGGGPMTNGQPVVAGLGLGHFGERPSNPPGNILVTAGSFSGAIGVGQILAPVSGPGAAGIGGVSRPLNKFKGGYRPKVIQKPSNSTSNSDGGGDGSGKGLVPNIGARNRSLPNLPRGGGGPNSARSQENGPRR